VRGVEGPKYKVGPRCSNPNCNRFAEHAHHIVSRSFLRKQPQDWVEIEQTIWQNKTGLCVPCHEGVTGRIGGYTDAIRLVGDSWHWAYVHETLKNEVEYQLAGLLDPQPLTPDQLAARATGPHSEESDACPFCGHSRRRRSHRSPSGERRRRKTWTVKVPDEAEEDGADVLDTLVDDLAPLLGYGADSGARYYVLVPTLYYAQQNRKQFIEAIRGGG